MTPDDWNSDRIREAFADLKEQNARILEALSKLEDRFVAKDALQAQVELWNERLNNVSREKDAVLIGLGNEMKAMRDDAEKAERRLEKTEQRRHTDRWTFGLTTLAGAFAIFGTYVSVGYFH